MRSRFTGLTAGLVIFMIYLPVFVSLLIPQIFIGQDQTRRAMSSCLPAFFGLGALSDHASPTMSRTTASSMTQATKCLSNQAMAQVALTLISHLHGDPNVSWDEGMPAPVVNSWASTCPPGSGCWIDWQNGYLQCIMLVKGASALASVPLPVVGNAIDFWSLSAHRSGWSEISSPTTPWHLPLLGDIMVWSHAPLGHVAIVTAVVPPPYGHIGSMTFAQANQTDSFVHGRFVLSLVAQPLAPDQKVWIWPGYQVMGSPFKYRFFDTIKQQSGLVLGPGASAPVCARADGFEKVVAACWAQ